ncbi:peptidyl-prolyl cis-trans isomerase B (cyclophilin B) [Krasilnikovia cinnamomea]|uniref:Peptidyl-prolyl cis-trans isomerase B (Cyclophilin B) n=1 Tax=Krasilnikovia cinnamomea TaxID=349313 RepID=A0A4Q7ZE65_9ACTN|nr:peptidylprolyl isomerase [Krasilnikovia cinnamomea]RZU49000.1 peptidyl-prolyl cis-trans isomerase B (cyclophilin B) [Krasilnikovia cinnamomea]
MSSIKDRQRAAARARLEKEMAERAAAAKKRRQRQAIIGSAAAVVLIAGAAVWIVTAMRDDDKKSTSNAGAPPAGTVACTWTPVPANGGKVKDVGTPPPNVPNTGTSVMTIDTNLGKMTAKLDLSKVPCTAASFQHLGSKNFWNDTKCHRVVNEPGFRVLQCGDPFAKGKGYRETDGTGGPSYTMAEENLPTDQNNPYPAGSIAMANTGQPNSSGSQFFIVAEDTKLPPSYTLVGKLDSGLDIVQKVVKAGDDGAFKAQAGGGHPKMETVIKSVSVSPS